MRCLLVVACAACGPGLATPPLHDGRGDLATAAQHHDVAAIRKLLRPSTVDGGLPFADAACAKDFAGGEIAAGQLDRFAQCLATLELTSSKRSDELPDVVVLTSANFELEARVVETREGSSLAWIGFAARRASDGSLPTITSEALEALRVEGTRDIASTAALEQDVTLVGQASAWLRVCLDATGAVTVEPRSASSPGAARSFVEHARQWKFKPFMFGDQAIPACAMVELGYPSTAKLANKLPLLPPSTEDAKMIVPPAALGQRLSGEGGIAPDDESKTAIQKAGSPRVIGSFLYCIGTDGKVSDVRVIRSTGLPGYDRRIITAMRAWTYHPYLDDDKRAAVCSAQTFIYSQH